jgi:hypothetical protein
MSKTGKRKEKAKKAGDGASGGSPSDSEVGAGKGGGPPQGGAGGGRDLAFPGWLPAVLYAATTLLLFRKFVFSGEMLFGSDTLGLGYMARAFFAQMLRQGIFPFWNPVILGGTPFLDSLVGGDSLYPTSLLLLLMEPYRALGWKLVIHVFLAGLFTYGWIRALGRSRAAALLAGLAFLLAPFMVTLVYPGHDGKLFVTALTPLLFWATERALVSGRIRAFGGMSLVIGLIILTTHFQQAYFLFWAVGIYAFVRTMLLRKNGLRRRVVGYRFLLFLAFSLVGAGVAGVQLLPAGGYVTEHSRRTATTTQASDEGSVAYSSSWSLHPEEALSLVVPEFVGSSVRGAAWTENTYWGRNGFKLNHEYAGLVVLLLAGLAFFGAPGTGVRLTFLGIGGVSLLYAMGTHTPVWRLFYELVPGISLFRAPSIAAFLFGFSAITLMAFGVDRVLGLGRVEVGGSGAKTSASRGSRGIIWFLAGATGILFLGTVLASAGTLSSVWVSVLYPQIPEARAAALLQAQPFIARGFLLATGLAAATLGLVWLSSRRLIPSSVWTLGIGVLLIFDLARVDDPFIQTLDFQQWAAADANVRFLQEQEGGDEPFRLLSLGGRSGTGQDVMPGMFGLELAGGHHPNDLARYRELIGMVGSGAPTNLIDPQTLAPNLALLAILNVRYVLWPAQMFGGFPAGEMVMATSLDGTNPYEAVFEIPTLPRARLVGEVVVLSEEETVPYLLSPEFRPAEEVVLNEEPPTALTGMPSEVEVRWLERGPNRLLLEVETNAPALLVLAENWYPRWKVRISGNEAQLLRANHTFRAVPVPLGASEVEVYFGVGSMKGPIFVTLVSLLLLAVVFRRGRRKE